MKYTISDNVWAFVSGDIFATFVFYTFNISYFGLFMDGVAIFLVGFIGGVGGIVGKMLMGYIAAKIKARRQQKLDSKNEAWWDSYHNETMKGNGKDM